MDFGESKKNVKALLKNQTNSIIFVMSREKYT